jgi:hypothetical protein
VLLYTKIQKPIKQRLQVYQQQHAQKENKQSTAAALQLVRP